jgi:hypothetical protein
MFRYLFGSDGDAQGTPSDNFPVAFPGSYLGLFRPKMFFFLSPSHIAAPPAKGLNNHIADGVPIIASAPVSFVRSTTFARASTATRVNGTGLIEVVPVNAPRYDHDPVTLAPKGFLLEEARTNLIPGLTTASRVGRFVNISINGAVSPTGSADATTVIATNDFGEHMIRLPFTYTVNTCTMSIFVKDNGQPSCYIRLFIPAPDQNVILFCNLTNGATYFTQSIWPVGSSFSSQYVNGWKRFVVSFNVTSAGAGFIDLAGTNFYPSSYTGLYTGNNANNVSYFGA